MKQESIAKLVRDLVQNSEKIAAVKGTSTELQAVKKVFANFSAPNVCLATNTGSKPLYWL